MTDATTHVPDDLALAWPVQPPVSSSGYAERSLSGTRLVDAFPLALPTTRDRAAPPTQGLVAVAVEAGHSIHVAPLVRDAQGWRWARIGDGLATSLVDSLASGQDRVSGAFRLRHVSDRLRGSGDADGERAMGVDQTNESVIVGRSAVLKWLLHTGPGPARGVRLREHLGHVGFPEIPALHGLLEWQGQSAAGVPIAVVDALLPDARDGWEWCVEALTGHLAAGHFCDRACPARIGAPLGRLTARLHTALARPSPLLRDPVAEASSRERAEWLPAARESVYAAAAIDAPDAEVVRVRQERMLAGVAGLADVASTTLQPIHGDLHVGQVLRWRDGLAVIDLDGPPPSGVGNGLGGRSATDRAPTARDVAQMLCSLDHVARVVDRRTDGARVTDLRAWAAEEKTRFLDAYRSTISADGRSRSLDERLVGPFVIEQLCRELLYAATVLPRWRYAPLGALRWLIPDEIDDR